MDNIAIIGATGGIGQALTQWCTERWPTASIWATHRNATPPPRGFARVHWLPLDLMSDQSIADFAETLGRATPQVDLLLVCTGWLHDEQHMPEKSLREVSSEAFDKALRLNATAPLLLVAKLESLLVRSPGNNTERTRIMLLSAKVGSISDNSLGGWHAYRMSKAALNMGVRNMGIEFARNKRKPLVVAVHPGTTHSELSAPFAKARLPVVDAELTAARLGALVENLDESQQGKLLHWDATEIPY